MLLMGLLLPQGLQIDFQRANLGTLMPYPEVGSPFVFKDLTGRYSPNPGRSYATATVSGVPSCVKRLSNAARTCSSAT